MLDDSPKHVQKVRAMSGEELQDECEKIISLKPVEPKRTLPANFRDTDSDPED